MRPTVYIETNFLTGWAKGQLRDATRLVEKATGQVDLAIPHVCFMEAFRTLESQKSERKRFVEQLEHSPLYQQVTQDKGTQAAKDILANPEKFKELVDKYLNELEQRLRVAVAAVASQSRLLGVDADEIISICRSDDHNSPTDDLILRTILADAKLSAANGPFAFLSGNTHDFEGERSEGAKRRSVLLKKQSIKYFSMTSKLLEWVESLALK